MGRKSEKNQTGDQYDGSCNPCGYMSYRFVHGVHSLQKFANT